jgi:isoquinoline 1-oxidoreductase
MGTVTVNGKACETGGTGGKLIGFLRYRLGLTGLKPGCGEGECGACAVLVDGELVLSCQVELDEVAGHSVTTIEGLAADGFLHPVQQALVEERASQCGYCLPGIALRLAALMSRKRDLGDHDVAAALAPQLCRCGCYARVLKATKRAAELMAGGDRLRDEPGPAVPQPELARPRRPWDLSEPGDREWFELLGDGLVVVWPPPSAGGWAMSGGAWLHLAPSGRVTAFSGKVDVGQDNRTAFRLLVAEELDVPVGHVHIVAGDTDVCPYDMGTFGSRSMPDSGEALRRASAGARQLLADLAARRAERPGCSPSAGSGAQAGQGDGASDWGLLHGVRRVEVLGAEPPLKSMRARRFVGRPGHAPERVDAVTGRRRFVSDLALPAMLYGAVLRPPVLGAQLQAVDPAAVQRLAGVTFVRDGDLAGVLAEGGPVPARRALALLKAKWQVPAPVLGDLASYLRSHPSAGVGWDRAVEEQVGDVEHALATAELRLDATYTTPYIAHVPLETRAALALWEAGRLTVWTGTQVPFGVRAHLAGALGLDEADVRVLVPPTGGAFGGKHGGDVALEAARLARAVDRPVMVHWSRAEEFAWGSRRPMAVVDVRAGLGPDGKLCAWDFCDINAGPAALAAPYSVEHRRLRYQPAASPVPQGSYRALGANANNFARESHIDELAHLAGTDPVTFRLQHLNDDRLANVLRTAAGHFGWGQMSRAQQRPGTGWGVAVGLEKEGRVATCAEVSVTDDGSIRVVRIVTAYECGTIVNRDTVANQIEGATVMALGGALFEELPWQDGLLAEVSLAGYRVPRFADIPTIDVVLVDRPDLPPAGAGETPMIAVAPAVANAAFTVTGSRSRSLPLQARQAS